MMFLYICDMTAVELRTKIKKAIDNAPDKALTDFLYFIDHWDEKHASDKAALKNFIDKVFEEDKVVLKRLAE